MAKKKNTEEQTSHLDAFAKGETKERSERLKNQLLTLKNSGYSPGEFQNFGTSKHDKPLTRGYFTPQQGDLSSPFQYQRGENQTTWDKAGNGVVNMTGRLATSAAEGIVNPFVGTFYALRDQEASSFYDNPFTQLLDKADKQIKEAVPFYQTREQEGLHGFDRLTKDFANTLWRDVADGVGFSIGAMATGGVYSKFITALAKTAAAGKAGDFATKMLSIDNVSDATAYIDKVNKLNRVKDGAKNGLIAGSTAISESGMNARSDAREFAESMTHNLTHDKSGRKLRELTPEEETKINTLKDEVGNHSFAMNVPSVMADNWLVFGKSMFGNSVSDIANLKTIGKNIVKDGKDAYKIAKKTRIDKLISKTYGVRKAISPIIAEGTQEQIQFAISKGTNDYYTKKYYNSESADFMQSMVEGLYEAYGTPEGWDNAMIGGLSGGIIGNVTSVLKKEKYGVPEDLVPAYTKALNDLSTKDAYSSVIAMSMRHGNLMEDQKKAAVNDDRYNYENSKSDIFTNYASFKVSLGKEQELLDKLEEFKSMSEEEFKSQFGTELSYNDFTNNKESVVEFVEGKINKVKEIIKTDNIVNERFPNASSEAKERLTYSSLTIQDSKKRKKALTSEVNKILMEEAPALAVVDYLGLTEEEKTSFGKELEEDININPMQLDVVKAKLADTKKLQERETQFIAEYKELSTEKAQDKNNKSDKATEEVIENQVEPIADTEETSAVSTEDQLEAYEASLGQTPVVGNTDLDNALNPTKKDSPFNSYKDLINKSTNSPELESLSDQLWEDTKLTDSEKQNLVDVLNIKRESIPAVEDRLDEFTQEMYPNIETRVTTPEGVESIPNKERERLSKISSLLSSKESIDLIDSLTKEGKDVNDLITLKAVEFNNSKSIQILLDGKLLGFLQNKGSLKEAFQQVEVSIKIGQELSNKQSKDLGFGLQINNGIIDISDSSSMLKDLTINKTLTEDEYVIFDQGATTDGEYLSSPELISVSIEPGSHTLPDYTKSFGRYVLAIKDHSNNWRHVPIYPTKLNTLSGSALSSYFKTLKSKIEDLQETKEINQDELDSFNTEITENIYIALNKDILKEFTNADSVEVSIDINPKGNLRFNINAIYKQGSGTPKYKNNVIIIKAEEVSSMESVNDLLTKLNEKVNFKLSPDSFKKSLPQGTLHNIKGDEFEAFIDPKVFKGQQVVTTIDKNKLALHTLEPEVISEEDSIAETAKNEASLEEQIKNNGSKSLGSTLPESGTVFRTSNNEATELLDDAEIQEISSLLPEDIEVQTKTDLNTFFNNIKSTKTIWGAFRDKVIYLDSGAGVGTAYHEAFHSIFRYGISDSEVNRFISLGKRDMKDHYSAKEIADKMTILKSSSASYTKLSNNELYDLVVEEYLADEFMSWKLGSKSQTGLVKLFNRIKNLLKSILNLHTEIDALFNNISRGDFAKVKATPNKLVDVTHTVYKNIPASPDTFISQSKSQRIINTYAALASKAMRTADSVTEDEVIETLLDERYNNIKEVGLPYINNLPAGIKKDKLGKQAVEEAFALTNNEAKDILKDAISKKLNIFTVESPEEDLTGEDNNVERFGSKDSWMLSMDETLPKQIRGYIAFAMYKTLDPITNTKVDVAVDSKVIYNGLSHTLSNTSEEQILNKWVAYAKDNEQAKAVLDMFMSDTGMSYDSTGQISSPTKNFNDLRKVIVAFKRIKVQFEHTEFSPKYDTAGKLISNTVDSYNANSNTPNKIQLNDWSNNLHSIVGSPGNKNWETKALNIQKTWRKNLKNTISDVKITEQVNDLETEIAEFGVELSDGYIRYSLLKDKEKVNSLTQTQKEYLSNFKSTPLDIEVFTNSGYGMASLLEKGISPYDKEEGSRGRLDIIAKGNSVFDESIATSNFLGADGNTRYDIILPSYALLETQKLRSKTYRNKLKKESKILENNLFIENDELLDNLHLGVISGIRNHANVGNEGVVFGDYSEREYIAQNLGYWFSQKNSKANFIFRQNESSNTAYIANLPVKKYYNEGEIAQTAIDAVYKSFEGEYSRISEESEKGLGNIKGYNNIKEGRAFRFTEFEFLVKSLGTSSYKEVLNSAKNSNTLSPENINKVKKSIKDKLKKEIKEFQSLLEVSKFGSFTGGILVSNNLIPTNKTSSLPKLTESLNNFVLNDYINSFALNQLLDGDYALSRVDKGTTPYTEGDVVHEDILISKQSLSVDIVKRHKGGMASGADLGLGTHRVSYTKDINTFVEKSPIDGNLIRTTKSEGNEEINSTDAQSLTNIKHIMFMAKRLGRLDTAVTQILRKIRRGTPITENEQKQLENAQISLNPIKTVTFGREFYIKTSEAFIDRHQVSNVTDQKEFNDLIDEIEFIEDSKGDSELDLNPLYAELTKLYTPIPGKEHYHNILNQMDLHGIDQVVSESASKGATIEPVDTREEGFNLSSSMVDIPNEYKRLQVETPTGKKEITSGTQLMQLIDSEQLDALEINGSTLGKIRKEYRDNLSSIRDNSFNIASKLIIEKANGVKDVSKLEKQFLSTLESSGSDDFLLEMFQMNWNLLSTIEKAEQLFLSYFSKNSLSQKTPGTKVSLQSDAHWDMVVDENDEVILNKVVKNNPNKYKKSKVRKLLHNVKDVDGNVYSECILSEKVFTKFGLKVGDSIPNEVSKMLGYRIPTQDKHSMMSLKVVDVLPIHFEGTGIFPQEIVYLSGADFDIDSLFIHQPAFWMEGSTPIKHGTEVSEEYKFKGFVSYIKSNKIFDKEYKQRLFELGDKEVAFKSTLSFFELPTSASEYKASEKELNNLTLNNKVLDAEISMLTNKHMLKDIAYSPVTSKPMEDAADEISRLNGEEDKVNYFTHSINGKFKAFAEQSAGKNGIGISANALQGFTFLAKNNIESKTKLIVDGKPVDKFKYLDSEGNRIADTLSTVLSVMTDNANNPLAGKIGLSLELLPTYTYLVSLGVPLRTASLYINTPAIKEYSKLLKEFKFKIKDNSQKNSSRQEKVNTFLKGLGYEKGILELVKESASTELDSETLASLVGKGINTDKDLNLNLLGKFYELEQEAQSFRDLNNIIRLTKGLPTSFNKAETTIVDSIYKLNLQSLFDSSILSSKSIDGNPPFEIKDAVKNDPLLITNLKLALKSLKLSDGVFITQTPQFKTQFEKFSLNLKDNLHSDILDKAKKDFLGFVSTKAYVNLLKDSSITMNDKLLYPELGGKTLAEEVIELKDSENDNIKDNEFIKWLKPIPKATSINNKQQIDIVSGKSFIKLSADSVNDLVDSFKNLYMDPITRDFSVRAFNYLLIKDNLEFRSESFVKYIAPFMFNNMSKALNTAVYSLSTGVGIENSLGDSMSRIGDEFRKVYASYIPNQYTSLVIKNDISLGIKDFKSQELEGISVSGNTITFDRFLGDRDNLEYLNNAGFESKYIKEGEKSKLLYKFPEFLLVITDPKTKKLYQTELIETEKWGAKATYTEIPQFGNPNVSPYSKSYSDNVIVNDVLINKATPVQAEESSLEEVVSGSKSMEIDLPVSNAILKALNKESNKLQKTEKLPSIALEDINNLPKLDCE